MRFLRSSLFPVLCPAFVFLVSFANAYGQAAVSQNDFTIVLSTAPGPSSDVPAEPQSRQPKTIFALKIDSASILRRIAEPDPHQRSWTLSDDRFRFGPEQDASSSGSRSNPGRKVRKAPLILGIAGGVVMAAGIVLAAEPCGLGPCFRTGGLIAAGVGGAAAVTGFYFAFRR